MAHVASPVVVATTVDETGGRWGFTASSFCALSLDPPLILVCLAETAACHGAFTSAAKFIVNVLAEDHIGVARQFSSASPDKFAGSMMTDCELGLPGLPDAVIRLACATYSVQRGGDHSILVGRVDSTFVRGRAPLIYHNRTYTRPHSPVGAGITGR
jgi:flavin reductase (DIM6/NTAB) family NADH-FMN oxidoreductase RutF